MDTDLIVRSITFENIDSNAKLQLSLCELVASTLRIFVFWNQRLNL